MGHSSRYEKLDFLGEGQVILLPLIWVFVTVLFLLSLRLYLFRLFIFQFATVYKARDTKIDRIVAVKKIKIGSREEAADGINRTALREIKLLHELQHENVIGLLDVFGHKSNVSLVFDFMDTDLEIIIKDNKIMLTPAHIKAYMIMTLKGLEYLHFNWILHRDLKPNNLLVNSAGILKIGDFGLAKFYGSPNRIYTHQVVTRWYRCPELLFGARQYGTGVDIWAVGCILAELLLRVPFLPGDSDLDQLNRIFQTLGTPNEDTWPDIKLLPDFIQFKVFPAIPLRHIFTAASDDLLMLAEKLLALYPLNRCTCTEALKMSYFSSKPAPTIGPKLPMPSSLALNNNAVDAEEIKPSASLKRKMESTNENGTVPKKRLQF